MARLDYEGLRGAGGRCRGAGLDYLGDAMSMARCDGCGRLIDTDSDTDCYIEVENYVNTAMPVNPGPHPTEYKCLCEMCRAELEDDE